MNNDELSEILKLLLNAKNLLFSGNNIACAYHLGMISEKLDNAIDRLDQNENEENE